MRTTLSGDPARFEGGLHEVGPGVHAWLQPDGGWGEANSGLVVGEGATAVVDTPWDQAKAREVLRAAAPLTASAPIRLAINTHSDGDHWWGNDELPTDVDIVTSEASLEAMREDATPKELARLRRLAGLSGRLPGRAGEMGRYVRGMLGPFDFGGVRLRPPGRTFSGRATEHVGGRALELHVVGPAHTPGDLVVHVPDAGVVFAADVLFVGATPVMWTGPAEGWIAALDALLALDADVFVPGHGPVCGPAEVRELRDYWTWLLQEVHAQHRMGHAGVRATVEILRSPDAARFRSWLLPERTLISVATTTRHLEGKGPLPQTAAVRAALFDQVASVRRALDA